MGIMKFFRYYADRHFHKSAYCNFLLVSVIFIFFCLPVSAQAEKPTLTVLNFKSDLNPKTELNPTQLQAVSDQVSSGLGRQGVYKVLDRVSSKERLKEIADQQRGLYDESKTISASRSLGADKILLGSVTKLGKIYVISAKIVDVGSTQSESQSEEFESLDRITDAVESLVKKFGRKQEAVTKKGMLWRSAILPGWGQLHSGLNMENRRDRNKGLFFMGGAFLLGAGLYGADSAHKSAKSDFQSKNTIDTLVVFSSGISFNPLGLATYSMANSASDRLDQAARNATIASALFIGFYAVNLLDVILFGGNDATAQNSFEEYILSKKDGLKFNVSASAVNGNLNREMFLNYDFHF